MSEIFYDAFISYRHTELDTYIAKKLHGMLEHYRIPKKIQKSSGKKKITRIFRDQEELPLSADLSSNIQTALEHSEFLIVICSPEAMESRWVKTEIETFLKNHSKDRVLTILVRGEPEEAFPQVLCYREQTILEDGTEKIIQVPVEPLAADVRASSKEEAGKKLKKEILRILAPMLSCRYDDLRQRQKEYKTKWIIRILAAVLCLAVAFGIYAARQAAAIEEQYQESRRNQARYLCNVSGELLNSGDRIGALQTALAIQTEDGKEPLVPEQMYALNNALYSYQNANAIYQVVERELEIEHPVMRNYSSNARRSGYVADFSLKGDWLFVLDQVGNVYIFDSITGENTYHCKAADFSEIAGENFQEGMPVSEKELLLFTETSMVILDIEKHQISKSMFEDSRSFYGVNYKVSNKRVAFLGLGSFFVYDYGTREILLEADNYVYSWDENVIQIEGEPVDMALSPSGNQLAVVFGPGYGEEVVPYHMQVYSLDTGECRSFEIENFDSENTIVFVDEEHIASLWINETENEYNLESYRPYSYGVYEIATGKLLWKQEIYGVIADYTKGILKVESMERAGEKDGVLEPMVITCMGNQIQVTQAETGEVLSHAATTHAMVGVERMDDTRLFAGTDNGDIYITTTTSLGNAMVTTSCQGNIAAYMYARGSETSAIMGENGQPILFYRMARDQHMTKLEMDITGILCNAGEEGIYNALLGDAYDEQSCQKVVVRNQKTNEILGEIEVLKPHQSIEIVEIFPRDGQEYVLYKTISHDYEIKEAETLTYQNLQTREIVYQKTLKNIPEHEENGYFDEFQVKVLFGERTYALIYVENENYFQIMDYTTGEIVEAFREVEPVKENDYADVHLAGPSDDGKYFIFSGTLRQYLGDGNHEEKWFLKLWDIEQKQWYTYENQEGIYLNVPKTVEDDFGSGDFIIGTAAMQAAVYLEEKEILMIDLLTGEVTQTIPYSGKNGCHMTFFDEERYLLFVGDDGHLVMWSLEEEKIIMKDAEQVEAAGTIYTDDSNRYFGITCRGIGYQQSFLIYSVDEDHQFYRFADIGNGFASFQNEEIFVYGAGNTFYYTEFYNYETLKARAEEILQGKNLTEEELRRYYISNQ